MHSIIGLFFLLLSMSLLSSVREVAYSTERKGRRKRQVLIWKGDKECQGESLTRQTGEEFGKETEYGKENAQAYGILRPSIYFLFRSYSRPRASILLVHRTCPVRCFFFVFGSFLPSRCRWIMLAASCPSYHGRPLSAHCSCRRCQAFLSDNPEM